MTAWSLGAMPEKTRIWMDGKIVPYEQATTHVLSHTLHYGLAAFEGIRAYKTDRGGTAVFRLQEHIDRLFRSCLLATIEIPFTRDQLIEATLETLRANALEECYIRPLVWLGEGSIKVAAVDNVVRVAIAAWPWGAYLGQEALERGVRCCVSSYARLAVRANYEKAKISGQYVNGVLAKREALMNGYDEALLLDAQGYVTEGTGENIFIVRGGIIYTPPRGTSILAGLTRDSVIQLARARGLTVREEMMTRSDLYIGDEVFLSGTAAEITPVREIDGRKVGDGARGPITAQIQSAYFDAVRGRDDRHPHWLTWL